MLSVYWSSFYRPPNGGIEFGFPTRQANFKLRETLSKRGSWLENLEGDTKCLIDKFGEN